MVPCEPGCTCSARNAFRRASMFLIAVSIFCCSRAVAARKSQAQAQTSQPAALVKFELSALDPHGEPVTDLRSSECQLSEDGKHEAAAFFHYDGNDRQKAAPAGPQEFSNREGFVVHPTVILLDLLSERLLTWSQAAGELVKALQSVPSGGSLYVYILTNAGTFYAVHPLPKTEAELRAANPAWTQEIRPLFDAVSRELAGFRPIDDQDPWFRAELTMRSLGQFASSLAAIPGRKNLVWITHGVPSVVPGISADEPVDLRPKLQQLGETFARADIAIYTVAQSASGAGESMGYSWETLQLLSGLTGGRAYSSDSVGSAITEAMADARGSYVVGYDPRREKDDGKHHKLRVTCSRKGVRLQTKEGYWAFPVPSSPAERQQVAFNTAAASPFDDSAIGLKASISLSDNVARTVRFQIRVDAEDLALPGQNDRYQGDLAIGLIAYSANGTVQNVATAPFQPSFTQEQVQQAAKNGIEITRDLAINSSTQKIRIVVFDRNSNLTGSVMVPLTAAGMSSGQDESRKSSEH